MGWLKRNLFFVIGVVVALGLLGAAGFYDYASWARNQTAKDNLSKFYDQLSELNKKKPSPGSGQVDNIAAANDQRKQL
jgi:predicted negative regulator of RcsB-dependent stress response